MNIAVLTAQEAVDTLELAWHKRYVTLIPVMRKLKLLSAKESGLVSSPEGDLAGSEDSFLLFYQMSKGVEAALGDMQKLTESVVSQFKGREAQLDLATTLKLEAVYARYSVIAGDLYRYLDRFRQPRLEVDKHLKKSVDQYLVALRMNCEDGKAFSGLYIVAATGGSGKVLLSAVYLLKSVSAKFPFNQKSDFFLSVANRIAAAPSELRDVPIPARAFVACVLELVALHLSQNSPEREEALLRVANACIPNKDFLDAVAPSPILPEVSWDVLLVVLLVSAIELNPVSVKILIEILKLLIGRALTFQRPLTILAAIDLILTHADLSTQVLAAVKREATKSFSLFPEHLAKQGLSLDHLLRFEHGKVPSSDLGQDPNAVAAARICCKCDVAPHDPSSASARRVFTPEPPSRSPTSKPVIILDAANLACRAAQVSKIADIGAVTAAHDYWIARDHTVKIFVSEKHAQRSRNRPHSRSRSRTGIEINLDAVYDLFDEKTVVAVPPQNHDDSYMIEYALRVDGVIVTNDMLRDWIAQHSDPPLASKWVQSHAIAYTFVDSMYIPNPDFRMPAPFDTQSLLK